MFLGEERYLTVWVLGLVRNELLHNLGAVCRGIVMVQLPTLSFPHPWVLGRTEFQTFLIT